jgi:hypothetical protein
VLGSLGFRVLNPKPKPPTGVQSGYIGIYIYITPVEAKIQKTQPKKFKGKEPAKTSWFFYFLIFSGTQNWW